MAVSAAELAILSRLLDEALDLGAANRASWLEALPDSEQRLRPLLCEMLAENERARTSGFLSSMPSFDSGTNSDGATARAGEIVGAYRLLREIGRGGMGEVWLAERADGNFERRIALKLPRLTWMEGLAARMNRERRIGALLEHPHIARMYDAGIDEHGRPFIAMAYIEGTAIDVHCREHALDVPARLRLFLQVVRAVAYAHGRLVIHRDLKPPNVLVDIEGEAHLLDFGIAKLVDDTSPGADLTQEQGRVLTPNYASPEQIAGLPVSVAADVYSLGVMLYELLTGLLPHAPKRATAGEMEDAVLRGDAPSASSRVTDKATARALRGEVDAILQKAMKREVAERYATADAFAEDVQRHLSGERVLARPDSLGYRMAKSIRRHRFGFAATGAVSLAVCVGVGESLVQARRASEATERARAVKEFVVDVFKVNERGSSGNNESRHLPVELLLERGASLIETRFAGQPLLQAELDGVVAGIFADMGANAQAVDYAKRHVDALVAIDADPHEQTSAMILLADSLIADDQDAEALATGQRALAMSDGYADLRPMALVLLARMEYRDGQRDKAVALLDRADRDFVNDGRASAAAAKAAALRASFLVDASRFKEGKALYMKAIEMAIAAEGPLSSAAVDMRISLGRYLVFQNQVRESKTQFEAALAALRAAGGASEIRAILEDARFASLMYGMDPPQLTFAQARDTMERDRTQLAARGPLVPASIRESLNRDLGELYLSWGDVAAAEPLISQSAKVLWPLAGSLLQQWWMADVQGNLDELLGKHAEADTLLRQCIELRNRVGTGHHPWAALNYAEAARNLRMRGDFDAAEAVLNSAPPLGGEHNGDFELAGVEWIIPRARAAVELDRGHPQAAWSLLPPENTDQFFSMTFENTFLRGEILCGIGRQKEGLERMSKALEATNGVIYEFHPALARAHAVMALCALAIGQRARAISLEAQARHAFDVQPRVSSYFKAPLLKLEIALTRQGAVDGFGANRR